MDFVSVQKVFTFFQKSKHVQRGIPTVLCQLDCCHLFQTLKLERHEVVFVTVTKTNSNKMPTVKKCMQQKTYSGKNIWKYFKIPHWV